MSENPNQALDLFGEIGIDSIHSLVAAWRNHAMPIIGCGRRKRSEAVPARSLYTSGRFGLAREIAQFVDSRYFIASAKHGLISPESVVEPYDCSILSLSSEERAGWAEAVLDQFQKSSNRSDALLLMDNIYASELQHSNALRSNRVNLYNPMAKVDEKSRERWLSVGLHVLKRAAMLQQLYYFIEKQSTIGRYFYFRDLSKTDLPKSGVYIFLDPGEKNFTGESSRIVRIGTHGVSLGSKSSLRTRLRAHLGQADGAGNHRSSVFRLHVGEALIRSGKVAGNFPSWGVDQVYSKENRLAEKELEQSVSSYIGNLWVVVVQIEDTASKFSLRALLENRIIALLSDDLIPIDTPSDDWLGLSSRSDEIRRSGLWNVRGVGKAYRDGVEPSLEKLLGLKQGE